VALKQGSYSVAIEHAEHALQMGKPEAKGARLTWPLLVRNGDHQRSVQVLNELVKENPTQDQAKEARKLLEASPRTADSAALRDVASSSNLGDAAFAIAPSLSAANLPSALSNPAEPIAALVPCKCG